MKPLATIALFILTSSFATAERPPVKVRAVENGIEVRSSEHDKPVLVHQFSESHGRPYLHPLRSPDGKGVLTEFSPGHHKHQTGLYWGPTRINGRDYFHNYDHSYWANTRLAVDPVRADTPPTWSARTDLLDGDGNPILREHQQWSVIHRETWYALDLKWTGEALVDVTIGQYDYGGLFLRMPWKPGTPAEVITSEGHKNQEGEGQPAKWVDLAMQIEGMDQMAHIALIDHPQNDGHPALWRIDDQFGVGPAIARRSDITIPKGESKTVRYRLVVYQGDFDRELIDKEQAAFRGP